jgi:hypothetical protein
MTEFLAAGSILECTVEACNTGHSFWDHMFTILHLSSTFLYFGQLLAALYMADDILFVIAFLHSTVSHLINWGAQFAFSRHTPPCAHEEYDTPSRVVQYLTFFCSFFVFIPPLFARDESVRNIAALAIIPPLIVIAELHLGTNDEEAVFLGLAFAVLILIPSVFLIKYVLYPYGRRFLRTINSKYSHESSTPAYIFHACVLYPLSCEDKRTEPTGVYNLLKCVVFGHDLSHEHPSVRVVPQHHARSVREIVEAPGDDRRLLQDARSDAVGSAILVHPQRRVVGLRFEYINDAGAVLKSQEFRVARMDEVEAAWAQYVGKKAPFTSLALAGGTPMSFDIAPEAIPGAEKALRVGHRGKVVATSSSAHPALAEAQR